MVNKILLVLVAVFALSLLLCFRSPRIKIVLPESYIGEVYVVFGDKINFNFVGEHVYKVDKNGLCLSPAKVPQGRIMSTTICYVYEGSDKCLKNIYGDRSKYVKSTHGVVVFAPTFVDYRHFYTQKDSLVSLSNGYLTSVVDSIQSNTKYDLDIKDIFN